MDSFAKKLESVYKASGEKKINVISHSMGGLLVKCFMSLHSDVCVSSLLNVIFTSQSDLSILVRYLRSMYRIGLLLLLHSEVSLQTCSSSNCTRDSLLD